ncbi:DUF2247 family protein [Peribacillus sp. NPDC097224]|uniref:DUF2247 family protein n=1 Tax=unclassified Peribacillus TaxID=2675266 RepID=UPI003816BED2
MNFSVDIFKQNKINYDWRTLYIGLKLDVIKYSDITDYAVEYLTNYPDTSNQNIIQLAWGGDELDYESLLETILKESDISDLDLDSRRSHLEKRKWRFGILDSLKMRYQDDFEELLNKVAEVYADFDYPKDMESFIHYLAPKDGFNPSQYSKEENEVRLINLFTVFLNQEKQYLQNDIAI